jgi:hypothetical protein
MQCAGASELKSLRLAPWRVVESQHEVSTRKLVQSAAEQELLEELIDRVKPPLTVGARQHYLLFTPFRYPPLRYGSRFGTRQERGIWYGAEQQRTCFAEVAYYRLLFLDGTDASLGLLTTALTAFTVRMRSAVAVDLVEVPFDSHRDAIASPSSYEATQLLGRDMRAAGVELFRFPSARDIAGGTNVGAFTPAVFHSATPQQFQHWHCAATQRSVEFARGDLRRTRELHRFERAQFLINDRLPSPAL